jgi:hypothetical protein
MNTKLHAVADANGRPLNFFMTAGQISDYTGAAALLDERQKRSGCSATAATTRIGSGTLFRPRASSPESRAGDHAISRSNTTSAATGAAATLRSCSAASRTSAALPPATISSLPTSSQAPLSPPPWHFGHRVICGCFPGPTERRTFWLSDLKV